jgi:hypothetical protein
MNLDFRSEQALAGARAFQRAQYAQRSYAHPSADDLGPAKPPTAQTPGSPVTRRKYAA